MWKEIKNDKLKSIVVVLGIIVFGIVIIATNMNNTFASTETVSSLICDGGLEVNTYLGTPVCCPSSNNRVNKAGDNYYCISSNLISNTDDYVGVDIVDSVAVCSINSSAGIIYGDENICSVSLGDEWSTIPDTCISSPLGLSGGRNCQCIASLSVCGATVAGKAYCSNGGVLTDDGCQMPVQYTIVFDTDGGNTIATKYITKGDSFVAPEAEKAGYTFKYWRNISNSAQYVAGQTITPSTSMTLKAIYDVDATDTESKTYTVYFYNGSTKVDEKSCTKTASEEHCTVYVPSAPSKEGHTFIGWSKDCDNPSNTKFESAFWVNDNNDGVKYYACFVDDESSDSGDSGSSDSGTTAPTTYTISYDANGGGGAPKSQTKTEGTDLTLSSTKPSRTGYTFVNWNTSKDGKGTSYNVGAKYTADNGVTLYAQWKANVYKISYKLNGGSVTGNPTSGTYNQEITIKNPTKTVKIVGNANKTDATIGKSVSVTQKFAGWTSSNIDTKNAYHGDKLWSNGSTKVTDTKFKNLSITNGATVTLVANWSDASATLPSVAKDGYMCKWNTKADGKGSSYNSGAKYTITGNSDTSINMYAVCEVNSKTDEEVTTNNKTGDALIYTVWVVGLGALGYSVYYFMKRRNSL